jgi:hypothetical protein
LDVTVAQEEQLGRSSGATPGQILERALEDLPCAGFLDPRRQRAIDDLLGFARKHKAASGGGNRSWREFIHEAHKY